jgi:hypothetical protein
VNDPDNNDWVERSGRIGLLAYGLVHLTIGWLALQLAFGDREGSASAQGAVHQLAEQPFGKFVVWLVAAGMFLLVVWQGIEAAFGHRDEEGFTRTRKRLASAGKAVVYAVIGVSAVRVAVGSGSSSKGGTDSTTAKVMDLPGGQLLVGAIGLAIIGTGAYFVFVAWTDKLHSKLDAQGRAGASGTAYLWLGRIGFSAKGVAFGIVGGLFVYAALTHEADKSGGLDQALVKVLDQPFGPVLLAAIALGFACFGVFCFARSRHLAGN